MDIVDLLKVIEDELLSAIRSAAVPCVYAMLLMLGQSNKTIMTLITAVPITAADITAATSQYHALQLSTYLPSTIHHPQLSNVVDTWYSLQKRHDFADKNPHSNTIVEVDTFFPV